MGKHTKVGVVGQKIMIFGDFYFSNKKIAKWLTDIGIKISPLPVRYKYYTVQLIDIRLLYLLQILYNSDPKENQIYNIFENCNNGAFKHIKDRYD